MKKELGIALLLVVLCIILAISKPGSFLSADNVHNVLKRIAIYGIFGIGLGIVIITGGIDLSVGSVFALQGVLLGLMLHEGKWPWSLAALASIGVCMVLGAFHGFLITKVRLQPFIVTLCGLMMYRSFARFITNDGTEGLENTAHYGWLNTLTNGNVNLVRGYEIPNAFILLLVVSAIMWVVLHRSIYGRYLYAIGRNEEAARFSGINTKLVIASAYVLCLMLGGISGILLAFDTVSIGPSIFGLSYELYGIAAAVLGGCSLLGGEGSILGIILGTALLQVLLNMVNLLGINSTLEMAVTGGVILIGTTLDQFLSSRKRASTAAAK